MTLRQRCLVTMALVLCLVAFPACQREAGYVPPSKGRLVARPITLQTGSDYCLQNGVEGGSVAMGPDGVQWTTPGNQTIELHFNSPCGFTNPDGSNHCDFGPTTGPINSGSSTLSIGMSITYSSMKLNGQPCNVGHDGLIMRR